MAASADPRAVDPAGRNALHHCVRPLSYGSYESVWLFSALLQGPGGLEAVRAKDKAGMTPEALVALQGSGRMATVLARVVGSAPQTAHFGPAEPGTSNMDVDADAVRELERVESGCETVPLKVHQTYGMSGDNRIYSETPGAEFEALLFKVDLRRDEMRFYHLQLVHEANKDLFVLFTRWGEIGESGAFQRTPAASKEEAIKEFGKVFREKTGNLWSPDLAGFEKKPNKYQVLRRRRAVARSSELLRPFAHATAPRSTLPRMLQRTIDSICDPQTILEALGSLGVDAQSMPFGTLSRETLEEARALLGEIRQANDDLCTHRSSSSGADILEAAKRRNELRERVLELSSRYYELVPRSAGVGEVARPLEKDADLAKEFEKLINIAETGAAVRLLLGAHCRQTEEHPMDYCYRAMGVAMELVEPASEEFAMLLRYAQNTCNAASVPQAWEPQDRASSSSTGAVMPRKPWLSAGDTITAIYRLARQGESERFLPLHNRRLLWHGSRRSNLIGILSQGLRVAPPEAPVSGYMFGKGVYFADMYSKSRGYCNSEGPCQPAYMLLCDVALGDLFPSRQARYMDQPQTGTSSTWGVGHNSPDWGRTLTEPGGASLPAGSCAPGSVAAESMGSSRGDFGLNYNEFIVYDPAQVRMRYLVELNNFECPAEAAARQEREKQEAAAAADAAAAVAMAAKRPRCK